MNKTDSQKCSYEAFQVSFTTKAKGSTTLRTKHKLHTNKNELIGKNSQEMGEDDTSTWCGILNYSVSKLLLHDTIQYN